ncbi:unnamed protein product [Gongylonema pulchrum]|uniref:TPR_REGION domain-containing protein n=1 Tax=Gongylonema pulchrum TaxID=637853 RepID=A0A183DUT4_9BILA|nr:unnamed protein product [Gongylonema pulchrum]
MPVGESAATLAATETAKKHDFRGAATSGSGGEELERSHSTPVSTTSEQATIFFFACDSIIFSPIFEIVIFISNAVSQSSSGVAIQARQPQHDVEVGSDVLQSSKRHRGSPMEQVSTTGRYMRSGDETGSSGDSRAVDEAEHEQQENVETTMATSLEGGSAVTGNVKKVSRSMFAIVGVQEPGAEISNEPVEEQAEKRRRDEEEEEQEEHEHAVLVDEEDSAVREASADEDNLSDEAVRRRTEESRVNFQGDEMLEEEMEDERSDAEEIDEEGEFDLPPPYRRPTFHPQRARPHLEPANDESDDDDGVILIEDAGEMEHSHSSAYLSIDEAQGDDRRHPDMEAGAAEAGDPRQGEQSVRSEAFIQRTGDATDSTLFRTGDDDTSRSDNSEAMYASSGEVEQMRSRSLDNVLQESADVVSGSEQLQAVVHDSPPLIENIESDSRGASSTVAPTAGTDDDNGSTENVLVIDEEENGNEVAEEEQTDDRVDSIDLMWYIWEVQLL